MFDFINKLLGKKVVEKPNNLISNVLNHKANTVTPTINRDGVGVALSSFEAINQYLAKKKKKAQQSHVMRAKKLEHIHRYHLKNGIKFDPAEHVLEFSYDGLLAKSGAHEVHMRIGFHDNDSWHDPKEYPMHKASDNLFKVFVPVRKDSNFYFAFRDSVHNWDNNDSVNYHGFYPSGGFASIVESAASSDNTETEETTATQVMQNTESSK